MANPKKKKNPSTSVNVVTKTPLARAGAILHFCKTIGTAYPVKAAQSIFKRIATARRLIEIIADQTSRPVKPHTTKVAYFSQKQLS